MYKLIFKMLMVVVVVTGALLYYLPIMNGKPPFHGVSQMYDRVMAGLRARGRDVVNEVGNTVSTIGSTDEAGPSKPVKVYRWQDRDGQWHFSNTPPSGHPYQEQLIDPDTNLVQAVPVDTAQTTIPAQDKTRTTTAATEPGTNPYSADNIRNLMDKSKAIRDQMNARNAQLEQLTNH